MSYTRKCSQKLSWSSNLTGTCRAPKNRHMVIRACGGSKGWYQCKAELKGVRTLPEIIKPYPLHILISDGDFK
jgi:hypothetical protein